MRYRRFARTGLYVSELCLGTMTFGGKGFWEAIGKLGASDAEALVGTALDAGVNFIDTADVYSEGESERLLGAALASLGRPRDQIIVATKVFGRSGPGPNDVGLSRAHILASIDGSLRRLKLDFVDLYQIHGFDLETPIEETARALDDLVRAGKVRYVGFCNLPAWAAMKALGHADARGLARFVSAQMYYSIAGRDIERHEDVHDRKFRLADIKKPVGGFVIHGFSEIEFQNHVRGQPIACDEADSDQRDNEDQSEYDHSCYGVEHALHDSPQPGQYDHLSLRFRARERRRFE